MPIRIFLGQIHSIFIVFHRRTLGKKCHIIFSCALHTVSSFIQYYPVTKKNHFMCTFNKTYFIFRRTFYFSDISPINDKQRWKKSLKILTKKGHRKKIVSFLLLCFVDWKNSKIEFIAVCYFIFIKRFKFHVKILFFFLFSFNAKGK